MDYPIDINTINMELSSDVNFLSLTTVFILAFSVDPEEIPPYTALKHFIWVF